MITTLFEFHNRKILNMETIKEHTKSVFNGYSVKNVIYNKESDFEYSIEFNIKNDVIYLSKHLKYIMSDLKYMTGDDLIKFLKLYQKKYLDSEKLYKDDRKFYYDLKLKHKKLSYRGDDILKDIENVKKLIGFIWILNENLKKIKIIKNIEYYILPNEMVEGNTINIMIET